MKKALVFAIVFITLINFKINAVNELTKSEAFSLVTSSFGCYTSCTSNNADFDSIKSLGCKYVVLYTHYSKCQDYIVSNLEYLDKIGLYVIFYVDDKVNKEIIVQSFKFSTIIGYNIYDEADFHNVSVKEQERFISFVLTGKPQALLFGSSCRNFIDELKFSKKFDFILNSLYINKNYYTGKEKTVKSIYGKMIQSPISKYNTIPVLEAFAKNGFTNLSDEAYSIVWNEKNIIFNKRGVFFIYYSGLNDDFIDIKNSNRLRQLVKKHISSYY